jgi:oligopeptide transport system ATP-binding protein
MSAAIMNPAGANGALLEVQDLKKHFPIYTGVFSRIAGYVYAVDGVSFRIERGETLGLVGESGCGKSTVGRTLLKLLEPTDGRIIVRGDDITGLDREAMLPYRRQMQMIYQDPYASLNPRMSAGEIVGEPLVIHRVGTAAERRERVAHLFERVGLRPETIDRFPHEFSGGQRQRIGIARALALNPKFIVCDEPIAALDVSIQAQVVNLLEDLQEKFGLTYLFISHDLSMVRHLATRVAVMYLGRIAEIGPSAALYETPLHPYTEALISAVPSPDPEVEARRRRIILKGDVPSPANPPRGCVFNTRCPKVFDRCYVDVPALLDQGGGRRVACHLHDQANQPRAVA